MKLLIAFGSTEGQTQKIAEWITARVRDAGHEAEVYDSKRRLRRRDVGTFDAIIVAGSVHQKRHQESIAAFALAHLADLEAKPSAFLSVSLSAALKDGEQDCLDYVEEFVEKSGWRPPNLLMVAGAVRFSEYDFYMEQVVRHVVMQGREPMDLKEDYELTDWDALGSFVDQFLDKAGA